MQIKENGVLAIKKKQYVLTVEGGLKGVKMKISEDDIIEVILKATGLFKKDEKLEEIKSLFSKSSGIFIKHDNIGLIAKEIISTFGQHEIKLPEKRFAFPEWSERGKQQIIGFDRYHEELMKLNPHLCQQAIERTKNEK